MKNTRDFKGVWIPKRIWLNTELTIMEKLFLVEIDSLDNSQGCYASNDHFAEFFGLSKQRCTEIIKSLEKKNFVKVGYIYRKNTKSIDKRIIKCTYSENRTTYSENRTTYSENRTTYSENRTTYSENRTTYSENTKDKNTLSNTLSNTDKDNVEQSSHIEQSSTNAQKNAHVEIVDYLNQQAGTAYRVSSKKTQSLINARMKEGFKIEDFKVVIYKMTLEWKNDHKMNAYLRPETLFGPKFEGYLNRKERERTLNDIEVGEINYEELWG